MSSCGGGEEVENGWTILSTILGWTAFVLWSVSFYPQAYTNWTRKAVSGLSFDFELYNIMGFSFLTVYNGFMLWNWTAREQYKDQNVNGCYPQVAANDFAFALHASILTLVHLGQIFVYDRGGQKISWLAITLFDAFFSAAIVYSICVAAGAGELLDLLYYLSYVKLFLTFIKYVPQVYMNWYRKSTVGWNVYNVLLDFTGGWLSLAQLLIDCWQDNDWSGITGNPVKFFLSLFSIGFDIIFMTQHYILYRGNSAYTAVNEHDDENKEQSTAAQPTSQWYELLAWFTTQTVTE